MTSGNTTEPNDEQAPPTEEKLASAAEKSVGGKPAKAKPAKPAKQQQAGVVPKKAAEDDPRSWGDSDADNDHDAWLREQKPPHWG
ncbi:hypothetical protein [Arthrobacter sp. NPDC056727]|uniref:hypothetical protein n=1 Tax=Arthrobacter sp. NPDC056727 TaxID=3345927 RepID=UPI00366DFD01